MQKSNKTGQVEVASAVYRVDKVAGPEGDEAAELGAAAAAGGSGGGPSYRLFSRDSPHNSLYVIVDPARKIATLMLHNWQPFW